MVLAVEPQLVTARPWQLLVTDKNSYGHLVEIILGGLDVRLLRPARNGEPE